ncbi:DUF4190 domain-containing protein [Spiractinospora alimapuensis]|uniref:DUF4190 domain-containing protein n=1 Tax=Spiractinospora alimapuensis TaxID=2820884 RepID=UPI001F3E349E|nr:DUF4190 domain-containing protein [Spiractinospora alimapuensis]QVQ51121.1 DUF4190 domain-containing protein [Spiractinospora alimapuensis]
MAETPPAADTKTDGAKPTVQRGGLWGLICSTLGLLILWYGIPLSLAGIVLGIRARRQAKATATAAPGSLAAIVLGVVGILLWGAAFTAYWFAMGAVNDWQDCLATANTNAVAAECDAEFRGYLDAQNVPPWIINAVVGD